MYSYNEKFWALPKYAPRKEQKYLIQEIIQGLNDDNIENIVVEGGTGVGKSAVGVTIGNMVSDCFILTRTKQLQNQYIKDFPFIGNIKGRSNFVCQVSYRQTCLECEESPCKKCAKVTCSNCRTKILGPTKELKKNKIKFANPKNKDGSSRYFLPCNDCLYNIQKKRGLNEKITLTNYHFFYFFNFDQRELLILDEAHKFETFLMSMTSVTLNRDKILKMCNTDIFEEVSKLKKDDELYSWEAPSRWESFLKKILLILSNRKKIILDEIQEVLTDKKKLDKIKEYDQVCSLINNIKFLLFIIEHHELWVVCLPKLKEIHSGKRGLKIEFKPIDVKKKAQQILCKGKKRLFLTGTVGNIRVFCDNIGIDFKKTLFIQNNPLFPVENRPIIKHYIQNMSGGNNPWKNIPVANGIRDLISKHYNEKGIIHTSSNEQAKWLCNELSNLGRLWFVGSNINDNYGHLSREELIQNFKSSNRPIILVGAGLKDGVDFPDDQCRFQILFKFPLPKWDAQARARNVRDENWLAYQGIMDTQQAYGRGIRHANDYCVFYIIDSEFERYLNSHRDLFNDYFLEAIVENDDYDNKFFRF